MSEQYHHGAAQGVFSSQQHHQQHQSQPTSHPSGFTHSSSSSSSQDRNTYAEQSSASHIPRTHDKCGPTATAPFLQEFNLVAEAAKRAQMAVVMRDLENVSL